VALCGTPELEQQIEQAVADTLPVAWGQRNAQVFELARALKAISTIADAPAADLKDIVREWHNRALPHISTKPFEETWIDFLKAWPNVRFPRGAEPVRQAFERALAEPLPKIALQYDGPKCRILVALCRELQRLAGEQPFYLACRTAGTLLDVDHTTANRWLFLLAEDGILEVVKQGSRESRKASRFRYLSELGDLKK
jgi:DNA-binding transcriptional ArsR family regulator